MYDYVVVGAGPTGLTIAWLLSSINRSVLLIDREDTIGGCHRVRRVNQDDPGLFTEHGPRIYMNSSINFMHWLKLMDMDFYKEFSVYKYQFPVGITEALQIMTPREILICLRYYLFQEWEERPVGDFLRRYKFSADAMAYFDKICRLTDGAGIDRYTMHEFMQLLNQNMFHSIYQPNKPTDKGLFHKIKQKLINAGVKIITKKQITSVSEVAPLAKNVVFATPLHDFARIVNDPSLMRHSIMTRYETYIPITLHWKTHLPSSSDVWGNGRGPWGIMWIVNRYDNSMILSAAISRHDVPGSNGLTSHQCTKQQLLEETYKQINKYMRFSVVPDQIVLSPGIKRVGSRWATVDHSYIRTQYSYPIPFKYSDSVYTVGTHNLKSDYAFTSIESAVANAVAFCNKIEGFTTEIMTPRPRWLTLNIVLVLLLIIFVALGFDVSKITKHIGKMIRGIIEAPNHGSP